MKQTSLRSVGQTKTYAHLSRASTAPKRSKAPVAGEIQLSNGDAAPNFEKGHERSANHPGDANLEPKKRKEVHVSREIQALSDNLVPLCDTLVELHRQRQDLHRAEKSLTLQIKAKCRRLCAGDKTEAEKVYKSMLNGCEHEHAMHAIATCTPFISARGLLEKQRKATEKQMEKTAKELPVYPWVESVRGFGALGFAQIVGESGDLSNYSTVSKLWKRLGLAVIDGGRQRRVAGVDALVHGYSPSRRSVVWNVGDSLFRANGPYSDVCRVRKDYEREKAVERGLTVVPAAKIPAKNKEAYMSDGHVHNRAKRYMEKRLIRDLWRAWRDYGSEGRVNGDNHLKAAQ